MLFGIDEDTGTQVVGWLMPDNPAAVSRVIARMADDNHAIVDATVFRPLLKEQGLHNTGVCGFILDEANCPGLSTASDLRVLDADTNILLYRRRPLTGTVDKKFFRLETQLFRAASLDEVLQQRFHMTYPSLELAAEETIRCAIALFYTPSIYASGRVVWRVWEPLLRDRGFAAGALIRDPWHELAERLLILKLASSPNGSAISAALGPIVETTAQALRPVDIRDATALAAFLGALPDELRPVLFNPLTYQLTAPNAFDPPPNPPVPAALESLADMDAVGIRQDPGPFLDTVAALIELPEELPELAIPTSQAVLSMVQALQAMPTAAALIGWDLAIYESVSETLARVDGDVPSEAA